MDSDRKALCRVEGADVIGECSGVITEGLELILCNQKEGMRTDTLGGNDLDC